MGSTRVDSPKTEATRGAVRSAVFRGLSVYLLETLARLRNGNGKWESRTGLLDLRSRSSRKCYVVKLRTKRRSQRNFGNSAVLILRVLFRDLIRVAVFGIETEPNKSDFEIGQRKRALPASAINRNFISRPRLSRGNAGNRSYRGPV